LFFESDYLLGVYDGHRMGGLRFKLDPSGDFLNNNKEMASPPWASLRDLEYASLQLENDDAINDPQYLKWLSMLVNPGSSLGGATPKASVIDNNNNLWIAKFPSIQDNKDVGAWEMVIHTLALKCGINVPEAKLIRFSGKHHTFLSKRFDRTVNGNRIHYASAMTLLGYFDGADYIEGVSYLELAEFLIQRGTNVTEELEQLWRRILFNILISNTDDHLRNHGFLLTKSGWRLSPAFDMNPNEHGTGLKLNVNDNSNDLDVSLAIEVAKYFKLNENKANQILDEMIQSLKEWRKIAKHFGIGNSEIELTKNAFKNILES
jgi:serine/threonine-protein kinase HipA